jgi:hypothetical protein
MSSKLLEFPFAAIGISSGSYSLTASYFLGAGLAAGFPLAGGPLVGGGAFFSTNSGLSYLLGLTFYEDSLTFYSF